jgi:hypothetical protein
MTILGPAAKRIDILVYKGVTWVESFALTIDDVVVDLTTGVLTADFRRSYDTAILGSFAFEAVSTTEKNFTLLDTVTTSIEVGLSANDPKSKFVYDIIWTPTIGRQQVIVAGVLTIAPVSTNV